MIRTASAPVAKASWLPRKVPVWAPGAQTLVVEDDCHRGADAAEGLGDDDHVGLDVVLLEREPGAGAPAPGLHLVHHERDVEVAGQRAQPANELIVGGNDAALALDHFEDYGGGERDPRIRVLQ
jgi:hypothetical protein